MPTETLFTGQSSFYSKWIKPHYLIQSQNKPRHVKLAINCIEIDTNGHITSIYKNDFSASNTPTHLASMSKQFFAIGLLHLIKNNAYNVTLEDRVNKHISSWPNYARHVKIKHLLNHSSGLKEYTKNAATYIKNTYKTDSVLTYVKRRRKLIAIPGQKHLYTNTNYVIIAHLIKVISGKSIARFMRDTFFIPLGMNHTLIREEGTRRPKVRKTYYRNPLNRYIQSIKTKNDFMPGDGGVYTTLRDLEKWARFLTGTSTLGNALSQDIHRDINLDNGTNSGYGYGIYVSRNQLKHSGLWNGSKTYGRLFLGDGNTPSVWINAIANCQVFEVRNFTSKMKDIYNNVKAIQTAKTYRKVN